MNLIGTYARTTVVLFLCVAFFAPQASAFASSDLEVSGWIPFWSGSKGAVDAQKHISAFSVIQPFGYAVKQDGSLKDLVGLTKDGWPSLLKSARAKDVLVTPTVMSSDGKLIHQLLSDEKRRTEHIASIIAMVQEGRFDGVDIDYEGKLSDTKDYFSLFLKELKAALGDRRLSCTVEARTPPDSLYKTIPPDLKYANDYTAIGTYCDRVEIMGYDQRRADIKLNALRVGMPYIPTADVGWVRKVVVFALKSIPKEKLVLGVPTYGHEYEVTVAPDWYQGYTRVGSINPDTAVALAKSKKIKPSQDNAGEMSFSYTTATIAKKLKLYAVPKGTTTGNLVAAQALAYANNTGKSIVVNVVSWSDVRAIESKIALAKEFGLRGVAIFKIDGQEDKGLWGLLTR